MTHANDDLSPILGIRSVPYYQFPRGKHLRLALPHPYRTPAGSPVAESTCIVRGLSGYRHCRNDGWSDRWPVFSVVIARGAFSARWWDPVILSGLASSAVGLCVAWFLIAALGIQQVKAE